MSINPVTQYPGKVAPATPDNPFGTARNITIPGDGTGTPWESAILKDEWGFQHAMLLNAGMEPNGIPDSAENSQLFKAAKASIGNGANLLSNHNFLIASPDDSQPPPDATPRSYPPGFQIFSGVFANETMGITDLTYIDGRVSFSGGDFYMAVPNTGALENITEFVASVADFDGKPRTRGVSFDLVGDEYRVTVGVDALEDAGAVLTPLGSVKFEQGNFATKHEATGALTSQTIGGVTNYQASSVADMLQGKTVNGNVNLSDKQYWLAAGTLYKCNTNTTPAPNGAMDFSRVSRSSTLEEFGGANDYWMSDGSVNPSPTDNTPALNALIAAMKRDNGLYTIYPSVGEIQLSYGGYYFSQPYNAKEVSTIRGVGSGLQGGQQTAMVFEGSNTAVGGSAGITYHRHTTDETSLDDVPSTSGSDGSKLIGVAVIAINKVPTAAAEELQLNSGVVLRARAELEDVFVYNFGGHGRAVEANTGTGRSGNANLFKMTNCKSDSCGYHGLFTFGSDANQGVIIGDDDVGCKGNGIREASFLGNVYLGTHSSVNFRDEHYVTYDAGDGLKWWWFTSSNPAQVSVTPGSGDEVWQAWVNFTPPTDSRPWTGSNVMETSGAIYSSGLNSNNNFYGVYTEGGSTGPVYLQQRDTLVFTANGTGLAKQSLTGRNDITTNGAKAAMLLDNAKPDQKGEELSFFQRVNSPMTLGYGAINSANVALDAIGKTVSTTIDVSGFGVVGATHLGVVYTNEVLDPAGLRRGDVYTEFGVRLGGQNGTRIGYGTVLAGLYYRKGDILFQSPNAGGVSYKQCTTAGVGQSTAVFTDATLN